MWFALGAWLYSWYLIRGLRHAYSGAGIDLGVMPSWLLAVMVLTSTILLGTTVCAAMRFPAWPALAIGGGFGLFGLTLLGQFAIMSAVFTSPVSLRDALGQVLETRGLLSAGVFVAGIPTILLLAGLTGLLSDRFVRLVPDAE